MNVPFEREHANTITADLVARFLGLSESTAGRVTDFNNGSNTKTYFQTIALRIEKLESKAFTAIRRAIQLVLYEFFGEGDGITTFVGFPALPALRATGLVRFTRRPGVTGTLQIPVGSRLYVPQLDTQAPKIYRVLVPATIVDGFDFVDTLAEAEIAGVVGNTAANTMRLKDAGPDPTASFGFLEATNPVAFLSGAPAELDEARRRRFTAYIQNLARAQYRGLEVGALSGQLIVAGVVTERVLFARAVPVADKRGLLDVYLDNGGGGCSLELVNVVQAILDGGRRVDGTRIPGYKAAGIVVRAKTVLTQIAEVAAALDVADGYTFSEVAERVRLAVEAHIFSLGVFADLTIADLVVAIRTVRGVRNVTIADPTTDVKAADGMRILPGTVTLTPMITAVAA